MACRISGLDLQYRQPHRHPRQGEGRASCRAAVKCRVRRHHVQTRSSRIMSRMRTALQCHIPRPRVLRSSTGPDAPVYWPARGLRTLNGWAAGPCRQFWGLGRSAHVSASPPENHCIASSDLLAGRFKPSPNAEALPWALRPSRKRQARRQNRQPCQNRERMSPYAAPCPRAPPKPRTSFRPPSPVALTVGETPRQLKTV